MRHLLLLAAIVGCIGLVGCGPEGTLTKPVASTEAPAKPKLGFFTDAEFASTIKDNDVVVVNFTADW